jgi:hypothetical protein
MLSEIHAEEAVNELPKVQDFASYRIQSAKSASPLKLEIRHPPRNFLN